MNLSNDIVVFKSASDSSYLKLYNRLTHSLVEVHSAIYEYLKDCNNNNFEKIYEDLSLEQINYLIDNNILVVGELYKQKKYNKLPIEPKYQIKDVYIHLTFTCNLRCKYCFQKKNLNKFKNLEVFQWFKVIKQLNILGAERINITGGEPLMYKGVDEIISYAKKLGLKVTLLTNGMLVNPKNEIYQILDNVVISLDSIKPNLRIGVDTGLVLNNIKTLNGLKKCNVSVRSVFTRGLESECMDIKHKVESMGLQHISAMCMPSNYEEIKLMPDYNKYGLADEEGIVSGCGAGDSIISINPQGDVFPCQILMLQELKITNVLKNDWIEEYKKSDINKKINSFNTYEDENCLKCNFHHICSGGCRGNSYLMYGNFSTRPEYLCDYYRTCGRKWFENAK